MTQEVVSGGLARHAALVEGWPENVDAPFCSSTRWPLVTLRRRHVRHVPIGIRNSRKDSFEYSW